MTTHTLPEHILQISRRMAETRMLTPLLDYVVTEAIKLVGAERGFVVLTRPDGSLDFRLTLDVQGQPVEHPEDQISLSVLHRAIKDGEPLLLRNAVDDPHFGQASSVIILQLRSIMCVPLMARGETIGAIYVENRSISNRFKPEDIHPLILFANQAAVAIENAALNDDLEARVTTRTLDLEAARQQLEKSWSEAVEVNRLKTVWLNQLVHDLRAPLGIASLATSAILDSDAGNLNHSQVEFLNKALRSVRHAGQLIEDIFLLARLEEGQFKLNPELIDLEQLLIEVYDLGRGLPWAEGIDFRLDIAKSLPPVNLDAARIRQVVLNLLTNAQKFTQHGSVTLGARSVPQQKRAQISVSDTGPGIPADQLEQIFERFWQAQQPLELRQRGAGLGLAICRELVERHGGQIWAESAPGTGATFTFSLPIAGPIAQQ